MTGNEGDKPRSPFWILLWTGFALSVVSAVVDHDADYVLGTGLSAVFSAMDIALSLWMAVALVKRCRWAKFAYVVVAVLNGLLFAFGCCELMSDNFLIDLIDAASLLVIPAACSVLLLFSKPLRGEFTGRVMPRLTFYLTVWLSVNIGFLGLCVFSSAGDSYLPRCMEAAKDDRAWRHAISWRCCLRFRPRGWKGSGYIAMGGWFVPMKMRESRFMNT